MLDQNKIDELHTKWDNGNKSEVYEEYIKLSEVNKAYFLYFMPVDEQPKFCAYLENK